MTLTFDLHLIISPLNSVVFLQGILEDGQMDKNLEIVQCIVERIESMSYKYSIKWKILPEAVGHHLRPEEHKKQ